MPPLTDTDALNRICSMINDPLLSGADAYMEIVNIVTAAGRPVVSEPLDITASVRRNDYGLAVANVDTDEADVTVTVYQRLRDSGGGSVAIAVEITTDDGPIHPTNLVVEINHTAIYPLSSENA